MLRINKQGFTLIELMVVIVIIGVLASLAIPRFTEASAKAKAAEAPRVIASYESALLAAVPEMKSTEIDTIKGDVLIVDIPKDSKWFKYAFGDGTENGSGGDALKSGLKFKATPSEKIGRLETTYILQSVYKKAEDNVKKSDCFEHTVNNSKTDAVGMAMVPSFLRSGCNIIEE